MRDTRGKFPRGVAIASGVLVGLCAASAFAADGTLKVEQGLQWFDGPVPGQVCFNGQIGGGEFGVYDFNLTNASLNLLAIDPTAKVTATVNGIQGFDFQTFCLEPGVHLDFHVDLQFTVSNSVQLADGTTRNLSPNTAYLFTKFYKAIAFTNAYVYSPLGNPRSGSAADMQAALWFTEGVWGNPFNTLPPNAQNYVTEAQTETAPGGSWDSLWGQTFPQNLGGVSALNIQTMAGARQQDFLAIFVTSPPPPPPPDGDCTGFTPGFWHNKNGKKLIQASGDGPAWSWLGILNDIDLVDAKGDDVDFAESSDGFKEFSGWLVSGNNAKNMAMKLSQHVAAMQLNILRGGVDGEPGADLDCLVYTGQNSDCVGGVDTISIGEVLDLAIDALADDNYTPEGDPNREYQECLKNILDAANNNLNWVN